ncbi:ABC transporter [Actinomyces viscosus]|uniref:ABC-2 type transporter n=1 Tax=Actinomyces viscosus TaxID=1656 RepID=A0A448PHL1_ACTVI|nr:ABC transporter permease [Actinomyces viscosus]TFH52049.1 ABC transporter [Actinomyces viscosus]VEI14408.1 ABC-2 type transporter [Actinomyces viscosus]
MSEASWATWSGGQPFWGDRSEVIVSVVELSELSPVGRRPPLPSYLHQLWQRRHFIWADARAKALSSQRGTFLGNAWLIAKPMLDAIVFFIVFGLLLQTSRGIDNFVGYLIIGVTFFPPLQRAVTGGSQVMVAGKNLIRGFSFPRAALPVSYTIRCAIDLVPPMIAALVLVAVLPPHAWPSWHWLLALPVFALQMLLILGLVLVTSRITTTIPDMRNIWPFLTRFWFYVSGVFFSYERFIDHPVVLRAMDLNPGYLMITMYRDAILYQRVPQARMWLILSAWSLGLTLTALVLFWEKEEDYGAER